MITFIFFFGVFITLPNSLEFTPSRKQKIGIQKVGIKEELRNGRLELRCVQHSISGDLLNSVYLVVLPAIFVFFYHCY